MDVIRGANHHCVETAGRLGEEGGKQGEHIDGVPGAQVEVEEKRGKSLFCDDSWHQQNDKKHPVRERERKSQRFERRLRPVTL